jgi:hypothetical protein
VKLGRSRQTLTRTAYCQLQGKLGVCPAESCRLDAAAGAGWLAAGTAAMVCDPLCAPSIQIELTLAGRAAGAIHAWMGGDTSKLEAYAAFVAADFEDALQRRTRLYQREQRWSHSGFWWRRQRPCAEPAGLRKDSRPFPFLRF